MNGIFGYAATAPSPSREEAARVRDVMAARGPDGHGLWSSSDGRCVLAHRRLAILDLSDRALQPMRCRDGRYTIVFNGEIYNYPELRRAAVAAGHVFETTSDTEILLYLFARHGAEMLSHLRGMFAFAIWDDHARSLFLARDPFGIKPLFLADRHGTLRFASQVRALRAGQGIRDERDPAGVIGFMLLGSVPEPFTWYQDISALPAGHCMSVDASGVRQWRYTDLTAILSAAGGRRGDRHAALADARAAIRDSVKAHLLSDVPVGLFLSSGIDSAAVLGIAMEQAKHPIHAITLGFDDFAGTTNDEVPVARRIAEYYGAPHNVRRIDRAEFLEDLRAILTTMDQPSIDGINTWFVAKAARENGLKVALSGIGGDEMLGGYPSFVDVPRWVRRYGRLARLPGLGAGLARLMRTVVPWYIAAHPKAPGLLRHTSTIGGSYLVRRSLRLPDDLADVQDPAVVKAGLARLEIVARMNATLNPMPDTPQAAVSLLELSFYMRNQLLRDADWAGMQHSVEIRTPMIDIDLFTRLAPLIGGLPAGIGKQLLADAPNKVLPDWHRHRPKTGFSIPYAGWMAGIRDLDQRNGKAASSNGLLSRTWSNYVFQQYPAGA
ncbi:asparagine synthase (glutamine-hydrolyzing) [Sphingomonas qilianensis]|uniref:asparagine synthase (glutamine-hydrolyzing) n=1 Tax=Sphingomonas qilianensis TaxID=1736690 RepID=A0ABU9XRV6_9SPHN